MDFCVVLPNGDSRRILLEISNVILDNLGSPVYMVGRCSDINHWGPCRHVTLVIEDPLNFQKQKFPLQSTQNVNLLSKREREILGLLAAGYSSKSIADALAISYHTVNTHRQNMLSKLGIKKTTGLIRVALAQGLI
jgi:DNA-binding CsgD family transcriptional regulator